MAKKRLGFEDFLDMDKVMQNLKSNPELRKHIASFAEHPTPSDVGKLTDDELIEKLRSFDLEIDRTKLEELTKDIYSINDILRELVKEDNDEKMFWTFFGLVELWRRWLPDKPSFDLIDAGMQEGYSFLEKHDERSASKVWLATWKQVARFLDATGMNSVEAFDEKFPGMQSLSNWLQDIEACLWNAGMDDPQLMKERILFCEELLRRFPTRERLDWENTRRALAESYDHLGEGEKADALYEQWLKEDPAWGWGWIGWSDCYHVFCRPERKDVGKAEELLTKALAVTNLRDREDVLERLSELYRGLGRNDEAKKLDKESKALRAKNMVNRHIQSSMSSQAPRSALPRTASAPNNSPSFGFKGATGRNESCPCGSGKKYKKCCGRGKW
ncbi:MAG TPA: SEC-C metal-binding domain-containing protein [Candidatus Obscuribacterales bacterium]